MRNYKKKANHAFGTTRIMFNIKNKFMIKNQDSKSNNFADFATIAAPSVLATPYIPCEVFKNLPDILNESVTVFDDRREKDVFLTGALGVLSGCFPNVYGIYDGREVYPNLYTYVSAPAASGKGTLAFSRYLGMEYHEQIKSIHISGEAQPVLFIPGNTSAAAFMGHLQSNKNGIFFETEADTIGNTFKQDWGSFSDLLRKGYHHEAFSSSRKMNNEFTEIEQPKLSLVLSGTPEQIYGLVNSAEDGLFSRITFYAYNGANSGWKDVSPYANRVNYKEYFNGIGKELSHITNALLEYPKIEFQWTKDHWDFFQDVQNEFQLNSVDKYGDGVISLVRRSGIMWYRISMILSVLRQFNEVTDANRTLICNDNDFLNAHELMNTYKEHNLFMYSSLPKQSKAVSVNRDFVFLNELPNEFSRKEAVEIGSTMSIKERTVDYRLRSFVEQGLLYSTKSGFYCKPQNIISKN